MRSNFFHLFLFALGVAALPVNIPSQARAIDPTVDGTKAGGVQSPDEIKSGTTGQPLKPDDTIKTEDGAKAAEQVKPYFDWNSGIKTDGTKQE